MPRDQTVLEIVLHEGDFRLKSLLKALVEDMREETYRWEK